MRQARVKLRCAALLLALAALTGVACGSGAKSDSLNVYAAASLREAFSDIAGAFEAQRPGATVSLNFAGSQSLRTQIEHGAPADVFASANPFHTDALAAQGVLDGPAQVFTRNQLVLAVPAGNPARIAGLDDLVRDGLRIVVAGEAVPAGRYTRIAIAQYARAIAQSDFPDRVLQQVVSFETNVRMVVAKLELDVADVGVVYRTDIIASDGRLEAIALPTVAEVDAPYPIVALRTSSAPLARAFIDFVVGPSGQRILQAHGFRPAG